ncbi:integrase arm-type DNA-binding domain-containing protein [Paraburkholderia sp. IMGN_8]|uniref:tyrosine-type recombinase/integrase n=1 Tax=Paraburkholderia sp. IMGN_8 TaxID=3136564 RepID=UPI003100DF6B
MQTLHDTFVRSTNVVALFPVQPPVAVERGARSLLTDLAIKNAKPRNKVYRLYDTKGLYLEVTPGGSKLWRLKYRFDGKEKRISLGQYPTTMLEKARKKRDTARELLDDHIDPSAQRKAIKAARLVSAANTFEAVAREWFERMMSRKAKSHRDKIIARLQNDIFPWLGNRPIADITAPEVLACLRRIEDRGANDTAHRAKQNCSQVFNYAVACGRAQHNPTVYLGGALAPATPGHFAAVTDPADVGPLLRAMDAVSATFAVKCALRIAPYVFCRPGELRTMRWEDVDLEMAEWNYVPEKRREDAATASSSVLHLVPLATQVIAILRELHPLTGRQEYVFPGVADRNQPMSGGTVNAALRRAGYSTRDEHTGHGFRAMARTILHEGLGFAPEVIEHQLAHRVPDSLGDAYNRTRFLAVRRQMMQQWADYLDHLREDVDDEACVHVGAV